jgi:hypothetical protein
MHARHGHHFFLSPFFFLFFFKDDARRAVHSSHSRLCFLPFKILFS